MLKESITLHKIEQTIDNSMKAQKEWANLNVNERVKLLKNFVEDFLSRGDVNWRRT